MFSKAEVRRAQMARDLIAKSGYASKEDIMRLVSLQGNIVNGRADNIDNILSMNTYAVRWRFRLFCWGNLTQIFSLQAMSVKNNKIKIKF